MWHLSMSVKVIKVIQKKGYNPFKLFQDHEVLVLQFNELLMLFLHAQAGKHPLINAFRVI